MTGGLATLIGQFGTAISVLGAGIVALLCGVVLVLIARNARLRAVADEERELTRFRQLADATFSGVFVYRDSTLLDVNAALCDFMGCAAEDLVGHTVAEFIAPHDHARLV